MSSSICTTPPIAMPAGRPGPRRPKSGAGPEGRWRTYGYDELIARDKASLDIFWLKDDSLADSRNLPSPDVITREIVEDLEAALEQFRLIAEDLAQPSEAERTTRRAPRSRTSRFGCRVSRSRRNAAGCPVPRLVCRAEGRRHARALGARAEGHSVVSRQRRSAVHSGGRCIREPASRTDRSRS